MRHQGRWGRCFCRGPTAVFPAFRADGRLLQVSDAPHFGGCDPKFFPHFNVTNGFHFSIAAGAPASFLGERDLYFPYRKGCILLCAGGFWFPGPPAVGLYRGFRGVSPAPLRGLWPLCFFAGSAKKLPPELCQGFQKVRFQGLESIHQPAQVSNRGVFLGDPLFLHFNVGFLLFQHFLQKLVLFP